MGFIDVTGDQQQQQQQQDNFFSSVLPSSCSSSVSCATAVSSTASTALTSTSTTTTTTAATRNNIFRSRRRSRNTLIGGCGGGANQHHRRNTNNCTSSSSTSTSTSTSTTNTMLFGTARFKSVVVLTSRRFLVHLLHNFNSDSIRNASSAANTPSSSMMMRMTKKKNYYYNNNKLTATTMARMMMMMMSHHHHTARHYCDVQHLQQQQHHQDHHHHQRRCRWLHPHHPHHSSSHRRLGPSSLASTDLNHPASPSSSSSDVVATALSLSSSCSLPPPPPPLPSSSTEFEFQTPASCSMVESSQIGDIIIGGSSSSSNGGETPALRRPRLLVSSFTSLSLSSSPTSSNLRHFNFSLPPSLSLSASSSVSSLRNCRFYHRSSIIQSLSSIEPPSSLSSSPKQQKHHHQSNSSSPPLRVIAFSTSSRSSPSPPPSTSLYHSIQIRSGVASRGKLNSETTIFTPTDPTSRNCNHPGNIDLGLSLPNATGMEQMGDAACGEDAFFVSPVTKSLGIADGVGGWRDAGVDPKLYARTLMNYIQQDFEQEHVSRSSSSQLSPLSSPSLLSPTDSSCPSPPSDPLSPVGLSSPADVLSRAYYRILQEGVIRAGSSTACTIQLRSAERSVSPLQAPPSPSSPPSASAETIARLHYCNIGDSGFLVLRRTQDSHFTCVFRTHDILHSFNAPFQLGVFPPEMGPGAYNDKPSDADVGKEMGVEIMDGDIIVMATDGLFDNLFDQDIIRIVELNIHNHPMIIAQTIVDAATERSRDPHYRSPFAQKAGWWECGGKPDDITVVVSVVISGDSSDTTTTA